MLAANETTEPPIAVSHEVLDIADLTPEAHLAIEIATLPPPPVYSEPVYAEAGPLIKAMVTHYGVAFNGQILGCGNGYYTSENPTIVAVGPARHHEWPCGTRLRVCGSVGCQIVIRQDACPGCGAHLLDLSEAGIEAVCGANASVCDVTVVKVQETPVP